MKWLKSTTQKSYSLDGKIIPQCVTSDNKWLQLSNSEYESLTKNAVVKSLIKSGAILATDKEPTTPTQQVNTLTVEKAQLIRQVTELKEQIKASGDTTTLRAELDTAKAEAEAWKTKYEELEAEAKETISGLQAELEALKSEEDA